MLDLSRLEQMAQKKGKLRIFAASLFAFWAAQPPRPKAERPSDVEGGPQARPKRFSAEGPSE
ncbi:hypothetical protein SGRA_2606 [Saprospira grandis str. Lewin]|uniref:Uncharacterized protein n=1 Tax=Saprospira grandis (strain Lewin) TaxID=984262 RepID=H6L806_SAPGL|nr:hypothetical protein SGRA_2606 [Saprospira grandis str. Lewin]